MSENEKLALLEKTMDMDEGTLKPEMNLDDVVEYDSLATLSIMVMIEDEFGKKLGASDFKNFKTVNDILSIMNKG